MNKKITGLIGVILSIIILIYFEPFIYKIINLIGIDINNYSNILITLINIVIKLFMCFIIYIVYKKDFRKRGTKNSLLKNIILLILSLICITLIMYLFRYVVIFIGDIFNIEVMSQSFYNIFDKTVNFDLIIKIISDYIITPYLYCSIIILSIDKFTRRNDTCILFTGLLASVIYAFSLSGTLGYIIINSLSIFLLFAIFAFLYRKTNSILFIVTLYSFYLLSNVIIINYLGW